MERRRSNNSTLSPLEKASPSKFVWVHAQNERDHSIHEKVARAGAWVEFDGIGPKSAPFHLECVRYLNGKGLLKRTLISQDSGWTTSASPVAENFEAIHISTTNSYQNSNQIRLLC